MTSKLWLVAEVSPSEPPSTASSESFVSTVSIWTFGKVATPLTAAVASPPESVPAPACLVRVIGSVLEVQVAVGVEDLDPDRGRDRLTGADVLGLHEERELGGRPGSERDARALREQ